MDDSVKDFCGRSGITLNSGFNSSKNYTPQKWIDVCKNKTKAQIQQEVIDTYDHVLTNISNSEFHGTSTLESFANNPQVQANANAVRDGWRNILKNQSAQDTLEKLCSNVNDCDLTQKEMGKLNCALASAANIWQTRFREFFEATSPDKQCIDVWNLQKVNPKPNSPLPMIAPTRPVKQQDCTSILDSVKSEGGPGDVGKKLGMLEGCDCYICGLPLATGAPYKLTPVNESTKPECEHILPVFFAARFLCLIQDDKGNPSEESKKDMINEYYWSHNFCNRIKNDMLLFTCDFSDPQSPWKVDEMAIRELLGKIRQQAGDSKSKQFGVIPFRHLVGNSASDPTIPGKGQLAPYSTFWDSQWIANRTDELKAIFNDLTSGIVQRLNTHCRPFIQGATGTLAGPEFIYGSWGFLKALLSQTIVGYNINCSKVFYPYDPYASSSSTSSSTSPHQHHPVVVKVVKSVDVRGSIYVNYRQPFQD